MSVSVSLRLVGAVASLVALLASPAVAQFTRGTISGTVTDASGAVLPGATVIITHQETGIVRSSISSAEGIYRVPALDIGAYTVRIELDGFQAVENKDIPVKAAEEVTLNASLAVATLAEMVQVTAESSSISLNKTNPTIGFTASGRQVVDLPLSAGRDINRLALQAPNVFTAPGSTTISVGGNRARNNNFTIDGSDNNDISVTLSTTPIVPEAVAEFQLQVNPYNVEFGRNSGGQFNVITRSGTNTLHGDVWEYYRGSDLNAMDNGEKDAGLATPARFNRNQFGAGAGGPVVRNRMFFYGLFQGDRERTGETLPTLAVVPRVPTPAGLAALGSVPLGAGQTGASRQAVLGELGFLQDVYARNPTFQSVQNTLVNGVPIETGLVRLGLFQPNNTWNTFGRTDVQVTISDQVNARYIMNKPEDVNVVSNLQFSSQFAGNQNIFDQNFASGYTRILSPTLLNEFRFSYVRRNLQFPENDPDSPTGTITGFFTIGGNTNFPQGRVQDSYQFSDVLSHQRGRHALKLGADIRYIRLDNISAFDSKGSFTFNNFQDYINNLAFTFQQALQTSSFLAKQWQTFLFAQDDFKVTPNFTLNLGLRYELTTVPLGFFGAEDAESLAALVPGPVKTDTNNLAPRVGFAWSPGGGSGFMKALFGGDGNGVLRGGYGVTYDVLFYNILTVNGSNYPRIFNGRLDNAQNLYPNVAPVGGTPVFNALNAYVNSPEDLANPRTSFWGINIQRQLADKLTLEVGYLGNIGRNGINQLQANQAILSEAQAATVRQTLNVASIPAAQARREVPQFGARTLIASTAKSAYHGGYVSLDRRLSRGLQMKASYTYSRFYSDNDESLGVATITTGSPQIPQNYNDIDAEWSLSAFDRTHRGVVSWIYEMPRFGRGLIDNTIGGWQISGVFQGQSGQPFTIVTGIDSNGNGGGGDRPNFNAAGTLTADPDTGNLRTFTTANMFLVPLGTNGLPLASSLGNGNLGRNTLRAAAWFTWDLSVAKRFRMFTDHSILLRADFLNAFNQDNYGIPVNSLSNPSFGQNTQDWGNRSITLSAKYSF